MLTSYLHKNQGPFLLFLVYTASLYSCLVYIGLINIHLSSLIAQIVALLLVQLSYLNSYVSLEQSKGEIELNILNPISAVKNVNLINFKYPFAIVFLNVIVGVAGLFLIDQKLDYSQLKEKTGFDFGQIITTIGFLNILIAQLGGFFFQSVLIYMLAYILNCKYEFNFYLKLVGISYMGFLIASAVTVLINVFYIPSGLIATDLKILIEESLAHRILSKIGEFVVLALISFGIFYHERFSILKSPLVALLPSFLLLMFNQLFNTFL